LNRHRDRVATDLLAPDRLRNTSLHLSLPSRVQDTNRRPIRRLRIERRPIKPSSVCTATSADQLTAQPTSLLIAKAQTAISPTNERPDQRTSRSTNIQINERPDQRTSISTNVQINERPYQRTSSETPRQ
jgi:hypothetical protein